MKKLLSKTTKPFIIYVLIILLISIPVYYFVVDAIWKSELDEHNKTIARKTSVAFNKLNLSEEELQKSIALWNKIHPRTNIINPSTNDKLEDSIFTKVEKYDASNNTNPERLRCFSTIIVINNQKFRFISATNIEETKETIMAIGVLTIFFFFLIVIGLLLLTRKLSNTLWKPFRTTLASLKSFSLNKHSEIKLEQSNVVEFQELNDSIQKLIAQNVAVYQSQKEFTENAAHELQTPFAILKNKIDIFLQSPELSKSQYQIVEEMNSALHRSARINKNLLLLSKIENHQFDQTEAICFQMLLKESLAMLQVHFEQKELTVSIDISSEKTTNGNASLTEVLINNLLLNAIRHTPSKGELKIKLNDGVLEIYNLGTTPLDDKLLFQRFSKVGASQTGTGLGLAIANEICKVHDWKITYGFENSFHTFSVYF